MVSIIVAMDANRAIGWNGKLLAKIPNDMKYFKNLTMNYPVIMGRKTFESIPISNADQLAFAKSSIDVKSKSKLELGCGPTTNINCVNLKSFGLKNRINIVLSRDKNLPAASATQQFFQDRTILYCNSLRSALLKYPISFVIGGADVYKQALDTGLVNTVYITKIHHAFKNVDSYFPILSSNFKLINERIDTTDKSGLKLTFQTFKFNSSQNANNLESNESSSSPNANNLESNESFKLKL